MGSDARSIDPFWLLSLIGFATVFSSYLRIPAGLLLDRFGRKAQGIAALVTKGILALFSNWLSLDLGQRLPCWTELILLT